MLYLSLELKYSYITASPDKHYQINAVSGIAISNEEDLPQILEIIRL
jgi:hypothetical protein